MCITAPLCHCHCPISGPDQIQHTELYTASVVTPTDTNSSLSNPPLSHKQNRCHDNPNFVLIQTTHPDESLARPQTRNTDFPSFWMLLLPQPHMLQKHKYPLPPSALWVPRPSPLWPIVIEMACGCSRDRSQASAASTREVYHGTTPFSAVF